MYGLSFLAEPAAPAPADENVEGPPVDEIKTEDTGVSEAVGEPQPAAPEAASEVDNDPLSTLASAAIAATPSKAEGEENKVGMRQLTLLWYIQQCC